MTPFSRQTRADTLRQVGDAPYDLIVIGGGITGAGVLRDATLRGFRALLLEKRDFASGTSSKSSKLVHGGLRYLKQMEFALTRESCHERNLLTKQNPHLVRPIPFVFPIYKGDPEGPFLVRCGMWLYELLSGFKNHERHQMLSRAETLERVPDLNPEGLKGSAWYFDAAVDDVRLTLENLKSAVHHGASALNYAPVTNFLHEAGKLVGVQFSDALTGESFTARGTVLINATGVWVDAVRHLDEPSAGDLRPSKGIHLIVPSHRIKQHATVAFNSYQDRRMLFAIPWGEVTLIGTTDTFFEGDPDRVRSEAADVQYLLDATNHTFPTANLTHADLVATYAGIRPLIAPKGETSSASKVSREHQIFEDDSGLLSIAGGKLTTYRRMARSLVDRAVARLPAPRQAQMKECSTEAPLAGAILDVEAEVKRLIAAGQPEPVARHLVAAYGPDAQAVLELCGQVKQGQTPLRQGQGFLRGEVLQAVRHESALHLTDLLTRRMRFALWVPGQGLDVVEDVSYLMGQELGWSEGERTREVQAYRAEIQSDYRPIPALATSAAS